MQETTFLNANDQYDPGSALPYPAIWEIQGHGTVSADPARECGGAPETAPSTGGAAPLSRWFDVRLTFADGTRLDVLAVVAGGRLTIEELRADPPLPLLGVTVLAQRIGRPLEDACRAAARRPRRTVRPTGPASPRQAHEDIVPAVEHPAPSARAGAGCVPAAPDVPAAPADGDAEPVVNAPGDSGHPVVRPVGPEGPGGVEAPDAAGGAGPARPFDGPPRQGDGARAVRGGRRARTGVPRGRAGRRIAADAYRAAQRNGTDPVLAVMSATGRNRRRSLRLIAGAREDGLLTPRRHRRPGPRPREATGS
ncbi:hypothetical protein I3J07_26640 [Streptomyces clavuligerus]|uniref:Uncharacterized protein n=1 Tax=Streptomyces clavuligerus TaxID=1901 RepID=E2Q851_STRCL|nr:Hypothetical protein SCLAV_0307 [Streptomyces clavuligerus]QPL84217.1 hypothetical protein I3J07_26640 [Streptomyces clavuligerus]